MWFELTYLAIIVAATIAFYRLPKRDYSKQKPPTNWGAF